MRMRTLVLLTCLLVPASLAFGSPPGPDPERTAPPHLEGLPGPAGTGLLPPESGKSGRTYRDLDLQVETFLLEVVDRTRYRFVWKEAGPGISGNMLLPSSPGYWALASGGAGIGFAVQPPGGWDPGPIAAAVFLGLSYWSEATPRRIRSCRTFLDVQAEALRSFWDSRRGPPEEAAPPDLVAAVEERLLEVRAYGPCRGLLPPARLAETVRPGEPR